MTDPYPKTYDELVKENAELRSEVSSLQSSVGSLQSTVVARDSDIAGLRRPKAAPRVLSPDAPDKFRRPAFQR